MQREKGRGLALLLVKIKTVTAQDPNQTARCLDPLLATCYYLRTVLVHVKGENQGADINKTLTTWPENGQGLFCRYQWQIRSPNPQLNSCVLVLVCQQHWWLPPWPPSIFEAWEDQSFCSHALLLTYFVELGSHLRLLIAHSSKYG